VRAHQLRATSNSAGQQPAEQDHHQPLQPSPPGGPAPRHGDQQGGVRQGGRRNGPHQPGKKHGRKRAPPGCRANATSTATVPAHLLRERPCTWRRPERMVEAAAGRGRNSPKPIRSRAIDAPSPAAASGPAGRASAASTSQNRESTGRGGWPGFPSCRQWQANSTATPNRHVRPNRLAASLRQAGRGLSQRSQIRRRRELSLLRKLPPRVRPRAAAFFSASSRPSRDLGCSWRRQLAAAARCRVLDLMAGCGIRALRYGQESPGPKAGVGKYRRPRTRLALLRPTGPLRLRCPLRCGFSTLTAQKLLARLPDFRGGTLRAVDLECLRPARVPCCPWPSIAVKASAECLYCGQQRWPLPHGTTRPARSAAGGLPPGPFQPAGSWPAACSGVDRPHGWAMGRGLEPLLSSVRGAPSARRCAAAPALPSGGEGSWYDGLLPTAAGASRCTADQPARLGAMLAVPIGRWR